MKEPVDHILRPTLPWRGAADGAITECGYDAAKVKALTREDYFARKKDLGAQRCAMLTCMTCSQTAERWVAWNDDPRRALGREIEWEAGGYYRRSDDRGHRLLDELTAMATLVAAHSDEFRALVAEIEQRREWRERKTTFAARPKSPRTGL